MPDRRTDLGNRLKRNAAFNRLTADDLVEKGAEETFVQELRDRADEWEAQAEKLMKPKMRGTA